jgi:putative ATPase
MCTAPKSNSSKVAIDKAIMAVKNGSLIKVPSHLGDTSHSQAGQRLGKGRGYKYPHDFGGYVEQQYLPPELKDTGFYQPGQNGYELQIDRFMKNLPNKKTGHPSDK